MVKYATLLPILAGLIGAVNAHTRVYGLWVNGEDQGDGRDVYIRSPPSNSPVKDVTKVDIICNVNNKKVAKSVSVNAGDEVTFEWYHDNRGDDIIDKSHEGSITVYIADAASDGTGDVWTKIAESGLSNGVWAVDTLIANKGKHSVTLPASLAPGDYLLRAEIIALHESDADYAVNQARGAQFYPSCSQVTVKSGGSTKPPGTFNFIGGYSSTDPGILFNLYGSYDSYTIPGPSVWDGSSSGTSPGGASSSAAAPAPQPTPASAPAPEEASSTAVPTTPAAAPPAVSAVPTTMSTRTRPATSAAATYAPPPAASSAAAGGNSGKPKTPTEINKCLDEVNACIRQAQSSIGGAANFGPCESRRAACY